MTGCFIVDDLAGAGQAFGGGTLNISVLIGFSLPVSGYSREEISNLLPERLCLLDSVLGPKQKNRMGPHHLKL